MGQYHLPVNLDKREFIHPHKLGSGLKLIEQMYGGDLGTNRALMALLAVSNGRGGGDLRTGTTYNYSTMESTTDEAFAKVYEAVVGRWGGDRIAIVGDYAKQGDIHPEDKAHLIYPLCGSEEEARETIDYWRKAAAEATTDDVRERYARDANWLHEELVRFGTYTDISELVITYMTEALGLEMSKGSGWRTFTEKVGV